MDISPLHKLRLLYKPELPSILQDLGNIKLTPSKILSFSPEIRSKFPYFTTLPLVEGKTGEKGSLLPKKIGVVFSGGPAPGGHNVLSGLFDAMQKMSSKSLLIGFLDGPKGIIENKHIELTQKIIDAYRNVGGFHLLGSGRTKIESKEQMTASLKTCEDLSLDGLVIIGGDDSNTNAAILADFFRKQNSKICVVGVPKTIDADLKNMFVPIPFGFDTACKVYSEMIGNICQDAISSKKYTHFIKLMGRTASHITLECAIATQPNYTLIGEEVQKEKKTLAEIISECADLIAQRSELGKSYSVILVPEGLFQFIPEVASLIEELDSLLSHTKETPSFVEIETKLSPESAKCLRFFPENIQKQLLLQRDPHGNIQLSLIETEKLLADLINKELDKRKSQGTFQGSYHPMTHFLGYEGRCAFPSNFDACYTYSLGHIAALLVQNNLSGYMTFISNIHKEISSWSIGAVPITFFMHEEKRKGFLKPVIAKTLVDCNGPAFTYFALKRKTWALADHYLCPGPIQYGQGDSSSIPISINMELSSNVTTL